MDKKWPSYGQKSMPIYGINDILRAILTHNLAKYHHFSMRPGLFDKYQITYSLQFVAQNISFMSKKYIFVAVTQLNSLFKNEARFLIWASKNVWKPKLKIRLDF